MHMASGQVDFPQLPSLASGDFRLLLITLANSLDSDQDRQNFSPYLDASCLTL